MANYKRLLLVDDSEIDRRILRNILSKRFEITEVANGYAALEILMSKNSGIEGMLLDISMPVLTDLTCFALWQRTKSSFLLCL